MLYLKDNSPLYKDIDINASNISNELVKFTEPDTIEESKIILENSVILEEDENLLDKFRFNSEETLLLSRTPSSEEISFAPGEEKHPTSTLSDKFCMEPAFPYLFPNGKFGYSIDRDVKLSYVKYFNQRLLDYTQVFALDKNHIFYALSILQQLKLTSRIKLHSKRVRASNLTAGMISQNFSKRVRDFIASDHACQFMGTIKGNPPHTLAMVRQFGLPIFFMTLSSSAIRQKSESRNGCFKKAKHAKISGKQTFLTS